MGNKAASSDSGWFVDIVEAGRIQNISFTKIFTVVL